MFEIERSSDKTTSGTSIGLMSFMTTSSDSSLNSLMRVTSLTLIVGFKSILTSIGLRPAGIDETPVSNWGGRRGFSYFISFSTYSNIMVGFDLAFLSSSSYCCYLMSSASFFDSFSFHSFSSITFVAWSSSFSFSLFHFLACKLATYFLESLFFSYFSSKIY